MRIAGATVHFVSEDMDAGPIVAQGAVPVLPGDDEDALSARILALEQQAVSLRAAACRKRRRLAGGRARGVCKHGP